MNMHINIGDKFVAVKKMWFLNEGTEIVVTNLSDDGIVSFTFGEGNTNNGYMDYATFEEHFEKITVNEEGTIDFEITNEHIAEIMGNSEFETFTTFDKCTIVSCRLPNGFVITEYSSCVDSENYDKELAEEICLDRIADKIAELEAYKLQDYMWNNDIEEKCECTCDGNCSTCTY